MLAWEAFPYLAASKTYSSDAQITDSAPSAVAMTAGRQDHQRRDGPRPHGEARQLRGPEDQGRDHAVGDGRDASACRPARSRRRRITHATPGATYSHIANRDWESDADMPPEALAAGCTDIARQLVEMPYGDGLEVAMGGGRGELPAGDDGRPRGRGQEGQAQGRHGPDQGLARPLRQQRRLCLEQGAVRRDRSGQDVDHVLGLFEMSHMEYDHDRPKDKAGEPSLAEMADKAIDILARNPEGYRAADRGRPDRPRQPCRQRLPHADRRAWR